MKGKYGRSKPYYQNVDGYVDVLESQVLSFADFTDNADATGYIDVTTALPAGAIPLGWKIDVLTAFDASSTATVSVGIAGDLDRFSADTTQSVAAVGTIGSAVVSADACKGFGDTVSVRVTVTEDSDFGDMTEGDMRLSLYYIAT